MMHVQSTMGPEAEENNPPESDCCSIHEKIRGCNKIYWNLQTSILGMQTSMEWAFQVLPESDLRLIALNMQALQNQLAQIETYSDALQVIQLFYACSEITRLSQTIYHRASLFNWPKYVFAQAVIKSYAMYPNGKSPSK